MIYLRGRSEMKRLGGTGGIRDLFGSFSSSMSGDQSRQLKYYCMNCGKEHREVVCPNCGSKMKRVG
jgi:rubrerythrin